MMEEKKIVYTLKALTIEGDAIEVNLNQVSRGNITLNGRETRCTGLWLQSVPGSQPELRMEFLLPMFEDEVNKSK